MKPLTPTRWWTINGTTPVSLAAMASCDDVVLQPRGERDLAEPVQRQRQWDREHDGGCPQPAPAPARVHGGEDTDRYQEAQESDGPDTRLRQDRIRRVHGARYSPRPIAALPSLPVLTERQLGAHYRPPGDDPCRRRRAKKMP